MGRYYKTDAVLAVCNADGRRNVSRRQIGYWIETEVVRPTWYIDAEKRRTYLFTYKDLLRFRLVSQLRSCGFSLQRIRAAVTRLRRATNREWETSWLITDGRDLFRVTSSPASIHSLSKRDAQGQLAFSAIALGVVYSDVSSALADPRLGISTVRPVDFDGDLIPCAQSGVM